MGGGGGIVVKTVNIGYKVGLNHKYMFANDPHLKSCFAARFFITEWTFVPRMLQFVLQKFRSGIKQSAAFLTLEQSIVPRWPLLSLLTF